MPICGLPRRMKGAFLHMKKIYDAPVLELLAYCSLSPIGAGEWSDTETDPGINSKPWNDGELGWT